MRKKDFADIYSQWESSHDEGFAIYERTKSENLQAEKKPTVTELKKMRIQDELDLHNSTLDEALVLANRFIDDCAKRQLRKVRIITGKGLHSPNGEAVIRPAVIALLERNRKIREINRTPAPSEGGSGAIVVILK